MSPNQYKLLMAARVCLPNLWQSLFPSYQPNRYDAGASRRIDTLKSEVSKRYGQTHLTSMRSVYCDTLAGLNLDTMAAYRFESSRLGDTIGFDDYTRKLQFTRNVNGQRVPKAQHEQFEECKKLIDVLAENLILRRKNGQLPQSENGPSTPAPMPQGDTPGNGDSPTPVPTVPEVPETATETQSESETPPQSESVPTPSEPNSQVHSYLAKIRQIRREEMIRSESAGRETPVLTAVKGNRPAKNGGKMLARGIPEEAILYSLAMDWPEEARSRYGIAEYDYRTYKAGSQPENRHVCYSYFSDAVEARIPLALIGPSGTGKSTMVSQWCEDHGMRYGMCPMTGGATPSWLLGAYVLDGENPYRTRSAIECFKHGGVFVFEEMDAADPNMVIVANNLIDNEVFINPVTNEEMHRSPDFIPVANMNTLAIGQSAEFTGRSRLDGSTRNRFAIGRIEFQLDEDLETQIFEEMLNI